MNIQRTSGTRFLKFTVRENSSTLANSASFVDQNGDSDYVTITKSFLVNITGTFRGFDLYMETLDNSDNDEWDNLRILEGTSLRIELID